MNFFLTMFTDYELRQSNSWCVELLY